MRRDLRRTLKWVYAFSGFLIAIVLLGAALYAVFGDR
jgi:hypothetical protein